MPARVVIAETDVSFDAEIDDNLLQVLQRHGYPISTSCGGVASCGLCRVTVVEGSGNLTPLKTQELGHLGNVAKILGLRLACQSKIVREGEIVLRVPEVEDVEEKRRKKAERLRNERRPGRKPSPLVRGPVSPPADANAPGPLAHPTAIGGTPTAASADVASDVCRHDHKVTTHEDRDSVAPPPEPSLPASRHISRAPAETLIEWRPRMLAAQPAFPNDPGDRTFGRRRT